MPTYEYECPKHGIFEEFHSILIKIEHCLKCKEEGIEQEVKRLISLGGKGIVELYGTDLVDKLKGDAQKLKGEAAKDEKIYSNLLGEDKYQAMQTKIDQQKRNRR